MYVSMCVRESVCVKEREKRPLIRFKTSVLINNYLDPFSINIIFFNQAAATAAHYPRFPERYLI